MRGLHKSKRVTWAPDVNLCQIRLFLSEESPSQIGLGTQDHLQAKTSSVSHLIGAAVDDFLPPGFEGAHSTNHLQIKLPEIPVIKWRCPLRFVLDLNWQVIAGEESKEVEIQNQREVGLLEAVYPRPSAIPTNPSVSADAESCHYDDHRTPQIPITPIEDEDAAIETSDVLAPFSAPISSQLRLLAPGILPPLHCGMPSVSSASGNEKPAAAMVLNVEPSVAAAASAAFTAINQSNECGNMIDPDLLVKILSNPKLFEKLVTDYGAASGAQNLPKSASPLLPSSDPPPPVNLSDPFPAHFNRTANGMASLAATSGGALYAQPNEVGLAPSNKQGPVPSVHPVSPSPAVGLPQKKDVNYYKNLIQQHGGERQGAAQKFNSRYNHQLRPNQELINNPKSRDSKPRIMKPCLYFNSSRGCRNGANCAYQHDTSPQNSNTDASNAKRMKMDREISS
ncbi:zinc finger CCCH domain-containing protein 6-like isoform X1 [Durio zibethinus]|uniref:Zinc finger CCCH domain-containing protein 6-like isoform X1 n=1 Tax=Durio zibethinus TaxID=66656 RepID=A0A6P5ZYL1_DURZI|nr:zinc finger CCCH domain-containing protein 6-like isoform X1 [Durio zibethinus]XP_022757914.1 zinc finger CCCH domain-containing protein 6-like isoform X1 [Durio zibethinus]